MSGRHKKSFKDRRKKRKRGYSSSGSYSSILIQIHHYLIQVILVMEGIERGGLQKEISTSVRGKGRMGKEREREAARTNDQGASLSGVAYV